MMFRLKRLQYGKAVAREKGQKKAPYSGAFSMVIFGDAALGGIFSR
jgi:hypothetical protein